MYTRNEKQYREDIPKPITRRLFIASQIDKITEKGLQLTLKEKNGTPIALWFPRLVISIYDQEDHLIIDCPIWLARMKAIAGDELEHVKEFTPGSRIVYFGSFKEEQVERWMKKT